MAKSQAALARASRRANRIIRPLGLVARGPSLDVEQVVTLRRPAAPLHCLRPATLRATAALFVARFPGDVHYAVKCNPEPAVIRALAAGGVTHFDVASLSEVALVRRIAPRATLAFMHPVKPREAIAAAYDEHHVRDFSLDGAAELAKILAETGGARDLGLHVRIALPKGGARYDLSGKFGAEFDEAVALLRAARPHARRLGICFHVGSQCMDPAAYTRAIARAGEIARAAGVAIDVLDVGGGFPVAYPDLAPPELEAYMAAIETGVETLGLAARPRLWCEPGRALVAAGTSVVVKVLGRRGDALFVNDGVYGSLSDAGAPGFRFPARLVRPGAASTADVAPFVLFGPTCDSADRMAGPFMLPADVAEGDWIEIGQLGAYGVALATGFNGFDGREQAEVTDRPLIATPGHDVA
jgi:ornithine decarboxylase